MLWRKMGFETALLKFKEGFENEPNAERLALVWREGGEFNVLPTWLIPHFREYLDWKNLVIVMCLTRAESESLWQIIGKEVE